jgi:predicted kinase
MNKYLFIPIGISGSGKSTYFRDVFLKDFNYINDILIKNKINLNEIIINPDNMRLKLTGDINNHEFESKIWFDIFEKLLTNLIVNNVAILDATNVVGSDRSKTIKRFKEVDNLFKIALVFKPEIELCKERIKKQLDNNEIRSNAIAFVDKQFIDFKNSVVGSMKWNGVWNKQTKEDISKRLKEKFDEVYFIE